MKHSESDLQQACIKWFDYQYPRFKEMLFAVPNGGNRNLREAARLKKEGVRCGISDLILLISNLSYNCLCIEIKTEKGRQSESQKYWQNLTIMYQNKYIIIRSFDEFKKEIEDYFKS